MHAARTMPSRRPSPSADPPQLFRRVLPVTYIKEAETLYSKLLGLPGQRVSPGRHYVDRGGTILECFDPLPDTDNFDPGPNPDHVYFTVRDLEAALSRATAAGADVLEPIATRPWGERSFYVRDPFGNKLCFVDVRTKFTG